jgi:Uma2 family endonuclease
MATAPPGSTPIRSAGAFDRSSIPPLENGDRLTRDEFELRHEAMSDLKKAELIDGVVYLSSPVGHRHHSHPHSLVVTWLGNYALTTPGVESGDNGSVRLDPDSEPQPDAGLFIQPEYGGQAAIGEDHYIKGAPGLIAEIASSSVSYDLGIKLEAYCRSGVREYVVSRVLDRQIDHFVNRGGRSEVVPMAADDFLRSAVFPGLWIDPVALARGEARTAFAAANQGLSSQEHADFVARLEQASGR